MDKVIIDLFNRLYNTFDLKRMDEHSIIDFLKTTNIPKKYKGNEQELMEILFHEYGIYEENGTRYLIYKKVDDDTILKVIELIKNKLKVKEKYNKGELVNLIKNQIDLKQLGYPDWNHFFTSMPYLFQRIDLNNWTIDMNYKPHSLSLTPEYLKNMIMNCDLNSWQMTLTSIMSEEIEFTQEEKNIITFNLEDDSLKGMTKEINQLSDHTFYKLGSLMERICHQDRLSDAIFTLGASSFDEDDQVYCVTRLIIQSIEQRQDYISLMKKYGSLFKHSRKYSNWLLEELLSKHYVEEIIELEEFLDISKDNIYYGIANVLTNRAPVNSIKIDHIPNRMLDLFNRDVGKKCMEEKEDISLFTYIDYLTKKEHYNLIDQLFLDNLDILKASFDEFIQRNISNIERYPLIDHIHEITDIPLLDEYTIHKEQIKQNILNQIRDNEKINMTEIACFVEDQDFEEQCQKIFSKTKNEKSIMALEAIYDHRHDISSSIALFETGIPYVHRLIDFFTKAILYYGKEKEYYKALQAILLKYKNANLTKEERAVLIGSIQNIEDLSSLFKEDELNELLVCMTNFDIRSNFEAYVESCIQLAKITKHYALYEFILSIVKDVDEKYRSYERLLDDPQNYANYNRSLSALFKALLLHEDYTHILLCLQIATKLLAYPQCNADKKIIDRYFNKKKKIIEDDLIKGCLVDIETDRGFICLSNYYRSKKQIQINFVINYILYVKLNNLAIGLTYISRSINISGTGALPKNFLALNCYLIEYSNVEENYLKNLNDHFLKNGSFKKMTVKDDIVRKYIDCLCSKKNKNYILILITILIQTGTLQYFFENYDTEYFKQVVSSRPSLVIDLYRNVVFDDNKEESSIKEIRKMIGDIPQNMFSREQLALILWLDAIKTNSNLDFVFASEELLENYPKIPQRNTMDRVFYNQTEETIISLIEHSIHVYDQDRYFISIFNIIRTMTTLTNQFLRLGNVAITLLRSIIGNYDENAGYFPSFYLLVRSYLGYQYLLGKVNLKNDPLQETIEQRLNILNELDHYHEHIEVIRQISQDDSLTNQEKKLFYITQCTNRFDEMFNHLEKEISRLDLFTPYLTELLNNSISHFTFNRRLFQMYVGACIVENNIHTYEEHKYALEAKKYHYSLENVLKLIDSLDGRLTYIANLYNDGDKDVIIDCLLEVIEKKKNPAFIIDLSLHSDLAIQKYLVPMQLLISGQWKRENLMLILANEGSKYYEMFMNHQISKMLFDETFLSFNYAVCLNNRKEYQNAQQLVNELDQQGNMDSLTLNQLKDSINKQIDYISSENNFKHYSDIMRFSYMRVIVSNESIQTLLTQFYNQSNVIGHLEMCDIASKIYYHLQNGITVDHIDQFILEWGIHAFYGEIDQKIKIQYLYEIFHSIYYFKNYKLNHISLINMMMDILDHLEAKSLELFDELKEILKVARKLFAPFNDMDCYIYGLYYLGQTISLVDQNGNQEENLQNARENFKSVLAKEAEYPNNLFIKRVKEYTNMYVTQLEQQGILKVNILNHEHLYEDGVYYKIENIGFETLKDIHVTLFVNEYPDETIHQIKLAEPLRPGRIYADEYKIVKVMDNIHITIQIEYSNYRYNAVDNYPLSLKIVEEPYHRGVMAQYPETSIDEEGRFIGRKAEMDEILSTLYVGSNVVMYGTNGTGKSSLIYMLSKKLIPETFAQDGKCIPITIDLTADEDCNEVNLVNDLLDKIVLENCELIRSLKASGINKEKIKLFIDNYINDALIIRKTLGNELSSNKIEEILKILAEGLVKLNVKLFILWDNFEKVISSKNVDPEHLRFLRTAFEGGKLQGTIRIIYSGSNYLLEVMDTTKGNSSWHANLTRSAKGVKIGNMQKDDFIALMKQPSVLTTLSYDDHALEYLWRYTKGHAFYSSLIGNRVLKILNDQKVKRTVIYPSDIDHAIYHLHDYLKSDSDLSKQKSIDKQILQDIEDNIDVLEIGKILYELIEEGMQSVDANTLKGTVLARCNMSINNYQQAFDILKARDFVQEDEAEKVSFRSDLYLERFKEIFPTKVEEKPTNTDHTFVKEYVKSLISYEQYRLVYELYGLINDEAREQFDDRIRVTNHIEVFYDHATQIKGHNVNYIEKMQVNVKKIQNTISSLQSLVQQRERNVNVLQSTIDQFPQLELEQGEEVVSLEKQEELYDQYAKALQSMNLDEWFNKNGERILANFDCEIEHLDVLDEENYISVIQGLFLYDLLNSINNLSRQVKLDYAPVTILLSKSMERSLHLHMLPILRKPDIFSEVYTNVIDGKKSKIRLGNEGDAVSHTITIGTYTKVLETMFNITESTNQYEIKINNQHRFVHYTNATVEDWTNYYEDFKVIHETRNKTAHTEIIQKNDCKDMIEVLLSRSNDCLYHTIEYTKHE